MHFKSIEQQDIEKKLLDIKEFLEPFGDSDRKLSYPTYLSIALQTESVLEDLDMLVHRGDICPGCVMRIIMISRSINRLCNTIVSFDVADVVTEEKSGGDDIMEAASNKDKEKEDV